ncbi:hypothetical protein FGO68_gene16008 [Halteria grandinella]|uniref:Uncharacterized protein n=1 Tax=Halteria grandinella TaxID=5974 RepID=A0A8J8NEK6_HALGN|nr:hypothetical protein FGO68_gene16008 [Halteria grandinella]
MAPEKQANIDLSGKQGDTSGLVHAIVRRTPTNKVNQKAFIQVVLSIYFEDVSSPNGIIPQAGSSNLVTMPVNRNLQGNSKYTEQTNQGSCENSGSKLGYYSFGPSKQRDIVFNMMVHDINAKQANSPQQKIMSPQQNIASIQSESGIQLSKNEVRLFLLHALNFTKSTQEYLMGSDSYSNIAQPCMLVASSTPGESIISYARSLTNCLSKELSAPLTSICTGELSNQRKRLEDHITRLLVNPWTTMNKVVHEANNGQTASNQMVDNRQAEQIDVENFNREKQNQSWDGELKNFIEEILALSFISLSDHETQATSLFESDFRFLAQTEIASTARGFRKSVIDHLSSKIPDCGPLEERKRMAETTTEIINNLLPINLSSNINTSHQEIEETLLLKKADVQRKEFIKQASFEILTRVVSPYFSNAFCYR